MDRRRQHERHPLRRSASAPRRPVAAPAPPQRTKRDGLATAAMVLGIIGLSISWVPLLFVAGAVCAVLALVFGTIAIRRRKPENRGVRARPASSPAAAVC